MSSPRLPEQELVRLCARTHVDAGTGEKIQSLVRRTLDWVLVVDAANFHGALPMLFWNLNRLCPEDVPAPILADLREQFRLNAQRNLMLAQELLVVLDLLRANNISAIPFKGPLLTIMAYGDLALRQIADIDLVVSKEDLRRTRALLLELQYHPVHSLVGIEEEIFLHSNCALSLARENPPVILDLHWTLTPQYFSLPLDLDAMRSRLEWVSLGGGSVKTFCAEDLLLILCVHGARHVWERFDWLVSVAELARARVLDWDAVLARARAYRCERILLLGLALAHRLLDAELSVAIQAKIRADGAVARLSAEISARLWRARPVRATVFEDTFVDELHPLMFANWLDRARYYRALVFTPSAGDVAAFRLPLRFSIIYYLTRPIRLAIRFGPRWLRNRLSLAERVDTPVSEC